MACLLWEKGHDSRPRSQGSGRAPPEGALHAVVPLPRAACGLYRRRAGRVLRSKSSVRTAPPGGRRLSPSTCLLHPRRPCGLSASPPHALAHPGRGHLTSAMAFDSVMIVCAGSGDTFSLTAGGLRPAGHQQPAACVPRSLRQLRGGLRCARREGTRQLPHGEDLPRCDTLSHQLRAPRRR